jgi:hypothetical protein
MKIDIWRKKTRNLVASTARGNFDEIKSGGLHEKRAVAIGAWELFQHLLKDTGNPRKPVSRLPVAGPSF